MIAAYTKPRRRMRRPEQGFQAGLLKSLALILEPEVFVFAVPNGGGRYGKEAAILVGQGVVAGVPDLMVIFRGTAVGLELKAGKAGRVDPRQVEVHKRFAKAGIPVGVVRNAPEALDFLQAHGVPMRVIRVQS
jgi:hypothetical protein